MKIEIDHVINLVAKMTREYREELDQLNQTNVDDFYGFKREKAKGKWEAAIDIFDSVSRMHHQFIENPNQCSLWLH